jgi:hypothetical protein
LNNKYLMATALFAIISGSAYAADLPSRKGSPAASEYVRVCDAYGNGFFYIPGSNTCLSIGGMVRSDTVYVPKQDLYKITSGARAISTDDAGVNTFGWDVRARINLDARTQTSYGTVQTVISTRFGRSSGVLSEVGAPTSGTQSATTTTPVLEAAYIRFAGFTVGAARDNFQFMPPAVWGAQHWASFVIAPKQLAYTATVGKNISATIAIQDGSDTAAAPVDGTSPALSVYAPSTTPQINAKVEYQDSWGHVTVMGAARRANGANATGVYDKEATVWALGAGAKINLPMLGSRSAFWLTGAYANGMTEYTTAYSSNKVSAFRREVGGFVMNHPSIVYYNDGAETVKSWNMAALLQHWWTPNWRSNVFGSYGQITAPDEAKALVWDGRRGFGDAQVWSVGQNISWVPTNNFQIGLETIYANVKQDVRYTLASSTNKVRSESEGNWTARLRVERSF